MCIKETFNKYSYLSEPFYFDQSKLMTLYILKQKSYLYSKHSKDANIEFPFPCFLAGFGCYY